MKTSFWVAGWLCAGSSFAAEKLNRGLIAVVNSEGKPVHWLAAAEGRSGERRIQRLPANRRTQAGQGEYRADCRQHELC
jgi:hypothetical protein